MSGPSDNGSDQRKTPPPLSTGYGAEPVQGPSVDGAAPDDPKAGTAGTPLTATGSTAGMAPPVGSSAVGSSPVGSSTGAPVAPALAIPAVAQDGPATPLEGGSGPLVHYVDPAPFDPQEAEALTPEQEKVYLASQWRMMWWRLKRHKLAVWAGAILIFFYVSALFIEILVPYGRDSRDIDHILAPPQVVQFFHNGQFIGPFVYGYDYRLNMETLKREYTPNPQKVQPIRFFCLGDEYAFWGFNGLESRFHLFCPAEGGTLYLLGTDRLGRDMLSRIAHGSRISLTVGLIGIAVSFLLGITLGGLAGYLGGWVDDVIQRLIEVMRSIPHLPLWMALSAAVPVNWSPVAVYLCITIILGLVDWPGLARAVRSKLLALREEDYVSAAVMMGAKPKRIIAGHLLPNFMSHLIASITLSIPSMILAETALSFLGLGLRPPVTSWGVLLTEAQNIEAVVLYPWLMMPVVPVIITVLAFNFLGDGLRDAADPYKAV